MARLMAMAIRPSERRKIGSTLGTDVDLPGIHEGMNLSRTTDNTARQSPPGLSTNTPRNDAPMIEARAQAIAHPARTRAEQLALSDQTLEPSAGPRPCPALMGSVAHGIGVSIVTEITPEITIAMTIGEITARILAAGIDDTGGNSPAKTADRNEHRGRQ